MPLEGPVQELSPTDLLQLLFLSRRTGMLTLHDAGAQPELMIWLREGLLAGAVARAPETRLGQLLIRGGRATERQIAAALDRQRGGGARRLGEILADEGVVRRAEVERLLRFQIESAVFDLVRRTRGLLRFEETEPSGSGKLEVDLPTDAVLLDAARRADELAEITSTAPEPDPVPHLTVRAADRAEPLRLRPIDWEVLGEVDGARGLSAIARRLGREELEVARAVYALAAAGVVEVGARAHGVEGVRR